MSDSVVPLIHGASLIWGVIQWADFRLLPVLSCDVHVRRTGTYDPHSVVAFILSTKAAAVAG